VTGEPVQLLDGRYGPYVTDGKTNASLPRGIAPEDVTFERALDLLAERAARGPTRRTTRKKAGKKKATAKKTGKKKSARKTSKKTPGQ
jgi:DNA topoisomerase-1